MITGGGEVGQRISSVPPQPSKPPGACPAKPRPSPGCCKQLSRMRPRVARVSSNTCGMGQAEGRAEASPPQQLASGLCWLRIIGRVWMGSKWREIAMTANKEMPLPSFALFRPGLEGQEGGSTGGDFHQTRCNQKTTTSLTRGH